MTVTADLTFPVERDFRVEAASEIADREDLVTATPLDFGADDEPGVAATSDVDTVGTVPPPGADSISRTRFPRSIRIPAVALRAAGPRLAAVRASRAASP